MECNINNKLEINISSNKIKKIVWLVLNNFNKLSSQVSVNFVDGKLIRKLNNQYRGINKITDVLSFATEESQGDLGDIFICIPQIKRQARLYGVAFEEELKRMLIHGLLHLLGYDHVKKKEEIVMMKLQEKILYQALKI